MPFRNFLFSGLQKRRAQLSVSPVPQSSPESSPESSPPNRDGPPGSRDATGCNSLCGRSLCGNVTLKVEESARAMAAEGKTKALTTPLPR